jgi:succinate-semialdehyde dehydrogenase / glutarate-semialdehyde dehydrogenase
MELGGNAPFIVFDDADIDAAIDGAMIAKMRNMGEACTAANRFYVHEKVHDEFARKLTAKMAGLKMGNGLDDGVAVGPLVNKEGRDKVIALVDDAVKKGAKVLTGGKAPGGPGFFYPATVLSNVSDDSKMLSEEIFGPVASLQTFKSEDEVIARANETEYGLAAYLYTKDLSRGFRVSEKLEFGSIPKVFVYRRDRFTPRSRRRRASSASIWSRMDPTLGTAATVAYIAGAPAMGGSDRISRRSSPR